MSRLAIVLLLTTVASAAQTTQPSDATNLAQHGLEAARRGDYASAEKQLKAAIVLEPRNAPFVYNLGLIEERKGDLPAALEYYESYVRMAPGAPNIDGVKAKIEGIHQQTDKRNTPPSAALSTRISGTPTGLSCANRAGVDQAECYLKMCFETGARAYATDLATKTGAPYEVGNISSFAGPNNATIVTIAIRAERVTNPTENKDASWSVIFGDSVHMTPYNDNLSAYNIAKQYNACAR